MAVTRETLRLLDGLRIQIDATVDAAARDLISAWGQAWSEVAAEWDAAMTDLTSTGGVWPSPRQIRRAERAARALKATRAALRQVCDDFGARVLQDVPDLVADGARWQARLVASQMPPTAGTVGVAGVVYDADYFNRVVPRALDAIVERTTEQVTTLARQLPGPAYQALKGTLIRGVAVGDNPRKAAAEMVRRVRGAFDMPLYRALVIARTEMLDAHRASAYGQDQANSDVLAGWVWTARLSKRTCASCWAQHGRVHDLTEPGPHDHQQGRCARVPITRSWADLGFPNVEEPASLLPDAQATFRGLHRSDQAAILGTRRLALLDQGSIGWDDLSTLRTTPGWRDSWAPTPMRDLLKVANR